MVKRDFLASVLYIKILRQSLEARGYSLSDLLKDRSHQKLLQALGSDNNKLSLSAILDFWQDAARLCDDPVLGLHIGESCHLTSYGIFAHLLMNCSNLKEALSLICRYCHMMNEAAANTMTETGSVVRYALDFMLSHPAGYQSVEFHFASIIQLGRDLVARQHRDKIVFREVNFAHEPMTSLSEYKRIFGIVPNFDQPHNELVIGKDVVELSTNAPNKGLFHLFLTQVDNIYRMDKHQGTYSSKVNWYLVSENEWTSWPTLQQAATAIGLSASSLKRKLNLEGTTYQEISDGIRFRRAKRILKLGVHSVSEVGYQLGYNSVASFGRAFKRWSGESPTDYQKRKLASSNAKSPWETTVPAEIKSSPETKQ
ncbi:AraC family transcriptional regulator [Hahella ganghwensis]|uniref:AraC family transcriptional regulator n=1 Tax=Hahella ganghwensis TaxID=286420 RepID=UPI000361771E|nr:AraC family transcriptional regulator [Hahella ganghwensis]